MTKKMLEKQVGYLRLDYNSLKTIKEYVEDAILLYGDSAIVQVEQEAYGNGHEINIYAEIEETDEEYAARIKQEAYYADIREKKDREEFERLQKKFGN